MGYGSVVGSTEKPDTLLLDCTVRGESKRRAEALVKKHGLKDVRELLGISLATMYALDQLGKLSFHRNGKVIYDTDNNSGFTFTLVENK